MRHPAAVLAAGFRPPSSAGGAAPWWAAWPAVPGCGGWRLR